MSSTPVSALNFLGTNQSQGKNEAKASRDEFLALLGSEGKGANFQADEDSSTQSNDTRRERTSLSSDYYEVDNTKRLQDLSAVGSDKISRNEPAEKPREAEEPVQPREEYAPKEKPEAVAKPEARDEVAPKRADNDAVATADKSDVAPVATDKPVGKNDDASVEVAEENTVAEATQVEASDDVSAETAESAYNVFIVEIQVLVVTFSQNFDQAFNSGNFSAIASLAQSFLQRLQEALATQFGVEAGVLSELKGLSQAQLSSLSITQVSFSQFTSTTLTGQSLAEVAGGSPDIRQYGETSLLPLLKAFTGLEAKIANASADSDVFSQVQDLFGKQLSSLKALLPQALNQDAETAASARDALFSQLADAQRILKAITGEANANGNAPTFAAAQANAAVATAVGTQTANSSAVGQGVAAIQAAATQVAASNAGDSGQQGGSKEGQPQPSALSAPNATADSAAKAGNTSFARLVNSASPSPILDQVAFHIKTALKDGSTRIHIRLDPAELGKLDIRLHLQADGKTGVVVTADNKETLQLLQKDASGLEKALEEAGLKADTGSLSFNLRGGDREDGHSQAAGNYLKSTPDEEEMLPEDVITKSYVVNLAEGLNIEI